jgi:hypothetical protein
MKKIIAISVMFALIAGAVFADTAISGNVETRITIVDKTVQQKVKEDDDPIAYGGVGAANFSFRGSNTDGTLGGQITVKMMDVIRSDNGGGGINKALVWWKPVEQLRVFLGIDNDGIFDTDGIAGWSYHAGDNDYLFKHHWDFWRHVFPSHFDYFGLALSVYPVPGAELNLVLPTGAINWRQDPKDKIEKHVPLTGDGGLLIDRISFMGAYSLDAGKISFVYRGKQNVIEKDFSINGFKPSADNNGLVGLNFLLTAIDGMQILVGGSVVLDDPDMMIFGGLGFVYNGDGFGVKARAAVLTQGDKDMFITGSVMPFFAVGEKGQVLVDIGVSKLADDLGWFFTPAYRLGLDGGAFKIGLQVYSKIDGGGNISIDSSNDWVQFRVPMLLSFNF